MNESSTLPQNDRASGKGEKVAAIAASLDHEPSLFAHPEPSFSELADRCRQAGLKATPQRLSIFRALLASDQHPSPEAIFAGAQPASSAPGLGLSADGAVMDAQATTLSLATVYKTLESLQRAGLIKQVGQLAQTKRYDGRQDPHHHLVCTACGSIADFKDATLSTLACPTDLAGFRATEMQVHILGLCVACQRSSSPEQESQASQSSGRTND